MFYAKIWIVLLAVAAALAFGTVLVVPKTAYREVSKSRAVSLDRVQHNAELVLRLKARHWLDAVAGMARDGSLIEVIQQASDRRGDLGQLKSRARERVLSLASGLPSGSRPQLIIAVDSRGKQIARVGPGEKAFKPGKDGLLGYPLVEAALRGFHLDDTWNVEEKLYLMVASPIIAINRGRYAGALLLGRELDNTFAQRLKSSLGGADIVFYLRGSITATTFSSTSDPIAKLPRRYTKERESIIQQGRSAAIPVGSGGSAKTVIMAPLPGEASYHDAFYAIVGDSSQPLSFGEVLDQVKGQDLSWSRFPWLLVLGGLVVTLVVGLGLLIWEADLPFRRLIHRLEAMAKGELARLQDEEFIGTYGSIARHVNTAIERAEKRSPQISAKEKDIGRILGSPPEQAARPDLRMDPSYSSVPPMAAPGVQPLEQFGAASLELPTTAPDSASGGSRRGALPPIADGISAMSPDGAPAPHAPEMPTFQFGGDKEPTSPSLSTDAADSFSLEPSLLPEAGEMDDKTPARQVPIPGGGGAIDLPPAHSTLPPLEGGSSPPPMPPASDHADLLLAPESDLLPEAPGATVTDPGDKPTDDLQEYFREVYNSFVSIKHQCGESTSNLTFERFKAKLTQNRENLIGRYKCKSVKFQVYIKDGKAAIKATPVME